MRRLRASFLLRCVILAGNVGVLICFFLLGNSIGWSLAFLAFLVVFWFLAIEMNLLPIIIEYVLARRAATSTEPLESIWFVDLDPKAKVSAASSSKRDSQNPTIR